VNNLAAAQLGEAFSARLVVSRSFEDRVKNTGLENPPASPMCMAIEATAHGRGLRTVTHDLLLRSLRQEYRRNRDAVAPSLRSPLTYCAAAHRHSRITVPFDPPLEGFVKNTGLTDGFRPKV
jgi:hypothetical protein